MTSPIEPIKSRSVFSRLSHGETNVNIVGRWKLWFAISGTLVLVGVAALVGNGLKLGIDFTGGTVWEVPAGDADVADVETAVRDLGYEDVQVQEVTVATGERTGRLLRIEAEAAASPTARATEALQKASDDLGTIADDTKGGSRSRVLRVQGGLDGIEGPFEEDVPAELVDLQKQIDELASGLPDADNATRLVTNATNVMGDTIANLVDLEQAERERVGQAVSDELSSLTGSDVSEVTVDTVGPSWGKQISDKAQTALVVFLLAITLYITLRFEFRMAVATLAALVHDLVIVVGLYAVFQFPVTPATVIAVLTILGFSIYDGIVVFDRVDENTKLLGRKSKMAYSEMANLSLNQVLMRSLNTSITAVLPVLSILILGSFVLGAATLQEFGLALLLGVVSGAYSSLFIATPLLALLKEREPRYQELRERLEGRSTSLEESILVPAGAPAGSATGDGSTATITPRPRKQGKTR